MNRETLCLLLTPLFLSPVSGLAQELQGRDLQPMIDEARDAFEVAAVDRPRNRMKHRTVLRWANNIRGSKNGATLIWIDKGRPEAVCCIFPWDGRLRHAFGSLSRGRIVASQKNQVVWKPQNAGVEFKDIPGAPPPAATASVRKRQLSQLARQFTGIMTGWNSDNSDREELRLLSTPLYRYEVADGNIQDGALFAFVQGTDPEILLLIEAWSENDQPAKWQYAFARRTSGGLEARFRGKVVWEAEKYPNSSRPENSYISIAGRSIEGN